MMRRFLSAVILTLLMTPLLRGATYYVSPTGNDTSAGTSTTSTWKTIAKVNAINFLAGDHIYFQGDQTFSGRIYFDSDDKGTAESPIVVGSYGTGRATINAGDDTAIYAYNTAGLSIENMILIGSGRKINTGSGINFYVDLPNGVKLEHVYIKNIEASGFGRNGIVIGGWNGTAGYRDVRITNSSIHDNCTGVITYSHGGGTGILGNEQVYIGHCSSFNNPGISTANTGSGFVLGGVNGGIVEHCVAHDNGAECGYKVAAVGMFAYDANDVTFQFNESYNTRTLSIDGDGFDLDQNCTNCVMQYNYSHDNDAAGYMLCQMTAGKHSNNIIRYNISENDCRKLSYGALHVFGPCKSAVFHNNTVFVNGGPSSGGIRVYNHPTEIRFTNNVISTTKGVPLLNVDAGSSNFYQGNVYYSNGYAAKFYWSGVLSSGLSAFQSASGQEMLNGIAVGWEGNPQLTNPGVGSAAGYQLNAHSPLINTGLDLMNNFGINAGTRDYFGSLLPQGAAHDYGAHEFAGSAPESFR
jgi:hypothetical protein